MMLVDETTTTLVAAIPPTVTLVAPVKLVPVIVIAVPPAVEPEVGETEEIVGGAKYVNAFVAVAVPFGVVTATLFAPTVPAGVTAVMLVDETTTTLVAATPPTVTLVAPVKLVPVIVIAVPPAVDPEVGETEEIVGGAKYVNAFVAVAVPFGVVTATLFAPTVPAGVTAVTLVDETTTTLVAATPPTVTLVAPVKFVPVIVIAVPPAVEPFAGETEEIVGGAKYVNAFVAVAVPLGVVTATFFAPTVPAGVTAVTLVDETTTTLVAATPPTVTLVAPVKLVPVIVIAVPPAVEPVAGETEEIVGGATYVNAFVAVAVPFGVVTATLFAPAVPAGVTAVMLVAETTTTLVAATPPTVTLVAPVKFVPVIVIAVPPAVEPEVGETEEIVGGAKYVNAFVAVAVPFGVVTATLFAPTVPAGVTAVTLVDETTTTLVAATPPTFTLVAPVKLVPVIVIAVPPAVDPVAGETEEMAGFGVLTTRKPTRTSKSPGRPLSRRDARQLPE